MIKFLGHEINLPDSPTGNDMDRVVVQGSYCEDNRFGLIEK